MNEIDIRKYLTDNATVIQFPNKSIYNTYNLKDIVKLPIIEKSYYNTWKGNEHHFKPSYHLDYTLPTLENLFHFNFNINDFTKVERQSNGFDTSYLKPKQNNLSFNVTWYTTPKQNNNVPYDFITNCTESSIPGSTPLTDYHRMFVYPHSCSHITNNTITNNRILFISGDSQMIPIIPILCCYFKEIYYFDNRTNISCIKNLDDIKITDIIFAIGFNNQSKYYTDNLK